MRAAGVRPDATSLGLASSSAKMESALREPSRLAGAVVRRALGLAAPGLPPKKKFLIEDKVEGLDSDSDLSLGPLGPSSEA